MKKLVLMLTATFTILGFAFTGCEKNENVKVETIDHNCMTDNNIKNIAPLPDSYKDIFEKNYTSNKTLKDVDFNNASFVTYTNSNLKGIISGFKNNGDKTFVAYFDETNKKISMSYILDITESDGIQTVYVYNDNDKPELYFKINLETRKFTEVKVINNEKQYASWADCVGDAISDCMDDSGCAFMCTISAPFCVSAIMIACA